MRGWLVAETVHTTHGVLVHLVGEIDVATHQALLDTLRPHRRADTTLILDMAGVPFLDVDGARILTSVHGDIAHVGGRLVIWRPHHSVEYTLRVADLHLDLTIHHGPLTTFI